MDYHVGDLILVTDPGSEYYDRKGTVAVDTSIFANGEITAGGIFVRFHENEKAILLPRGSYKLLQSVTERMLKDRDNRTSMEKNKMLKKSSIKALIELADRLDQKGFRIYATAIDKVLVSKNKKRRTKLAIIEVPIPGFDGFTLRYEDDPSIIKTVMSKFNYQLDQARSSNPEYMKEEYDENSEYGEILENLYNNPGIGLYYKGIGSLSNESVLFGMWNSDQEICDMIAQGQESQAYMELLNRIAVTVGGADGTLVWLISSLIEDGTLMSGQPGLLSEDAKTELRTRYSTMIEEADGTANIIGEPEGY